MSDQALVRVLGDVWGLAVEAIEYRPVGFGSYHWVVLDTGGTRWFVTVDDLDSKLQSPGEARSEAFGRLRAALATAMHVRDSGAGFVVAPIPTLAGEPLVWADRRYGVALYPFVDGEAFSWGEFSSPAHRRGVLDLVVALHSGPGAASREAMADEFVVPHRATLELTANDITHWDAGPYARPASALLVENTQQIRRLLSRYDDLVTEARRLPDRVVLTHGEPHPGNTMLTSAGWVLIDWDTVLLAPPERDLWSLDPGDGSILGAYADATGTTPEPPLLELYRIRWDLADMALFFNQFERPHSGNLDDQQSWDILCTLVERLPA